MTLLPRAQIRYIATDFPIRELQHAAWESVNKINVADYWNGEAAPTGRQFSVRLGWSDNGVYALFKANQTEPLVVAPRPILSGKAMNLWDRDVVEIFLAPERSRPEKYFEFEAAPTGEWLDVAIDASGTERICDWEYESGMETASEIGQGVVTTAIRLNWNALGKKPIPGDVWLGNLLRCVGSDPERGYLAWAPTMTEMPNFHVPERFGEFVFVR